MGEEAVRFLPRFHRETESESEYCTESHKLGEQIMTPQPKIYRPSRPCSSSTGFSLIELLIVVAVILVIAAIAIPNFVRSKMAANEASSVQNLRNITTAEYLYSSTYSIGFSADLPSLGGSTATVDSGHAELIDQVLASGQKSGYSFGYSAGAPDAQGRVTTYAVNASPLVPGGTGQRYFYTDQTGVIRSNGSAAAGATDTPI
jgi:type IV pilus assembly protein PilA